MTDRRDRRGRDVADRLARRFGGPDDGESEEAPDEPEPSEDSNNSKSSKPSERSKPSEKNQDSKRSEDSVNSEPSIDDDEVTDGFESSRRADDGGRGATMTDDSQPSARPDRASTPDRSQRSDPDGEEESRADPDGSRRAANVKEAWESTYIYLPDDEPDRIHSRLHNEFDRLTYECGRDLEWKPKKNRHYYPVVALDGVGAIEEMSAAEFYRRVVDLGLAD